MYQGSCCKIHQNKSILNLSCCTVIICPSPLVPMNGVVIYSHSASELYSFETIAEYRCEPGFGLSRGDPVRICEGDGSSPTGVWSGVAPRCEGLHLCW